MTPGDRASLASPQDRHAVAGLRPRSLRARLSLLVGFIVAIVVGAAAFLELRMFSATLHDELVQACRGTARAVADDVELRAGNGDESLPDVLHQFLEVNPVVRSITVVRMDAGTPQVVASTSSVERQTALALAQRAIATGEEVMGAQGPFLFVGAPFDVPGGRRSVVVSASTATLERVSRRAGLIALLVMVPAVVLVTLLLDLLARRLVHQRIGGIRDVMRQAAAGDLTVRAAIDRDDEIGAIAGGLNAMLAELDSLSRTLQNRVRAATQELVVRNSEVEEMYQRIFDLREALGHAERLAAVGQTAANVAHQVGTPLNLISGYVQVLLAEGAVDSRTRRRLELIQRQIEQVTSAVRGLLDRARRPIPREVVEPAALVARVLEVAQPRLERTHVTAAIHAEPDLPSIEADTVQLELALLNLVSNAIDAMPAGGRLDVRVTRAAAGVSVEVADSGPGIPESLLSRVFEPWVTTKPFGQGTGLGLAIARGVIAGHGGTIRVENAPAGGAVFTIELPPARDPAGSAKSDTPDRKEPV